MAAWLPVYVFTLTLAFCIVHLNLIRIPIEFGLTLFGLRKGDGARAVYGEPCPVRRVLICCVPCAENDLIGALFLRRELSKNNIE